MTPKSRRLNLLNDDVSHDVTFKNILGELPTSQSHRSARAACAAKHITVRVCRLNEQQHGELNLIRVVDYYIFCVHTGR